MKWLTVTNFSEKIFLIFVTLLVLRAKEMEKRRTSRQASPQYEKGETAWVMSHCLLLAWKANCQVTLLVFVCLFECTPYKKKESWKRFIKDSLQPKKPFMS